jgi:hypothetical protein
VRSKVKTYIYVEHIYSDLYYINNIRPCYVRCVIGLLECLQTDWSKGGNSTTLNHLPDVCVLSTCAVIRI